MVTVGQLSLAKPVVMGRNNHERVSKVCAALKKRGIKPWFDEEMMDSIP